MLQAKTAWQDAQAPVEETADGPVLDAAADTLDALIARGWERGHVARGELDGALPPGEADADRMEDTLAVLSGLGIAVVGDSEAEESAAGERPQAASTRGALPAGEDVAGLTDDPIRIYLREMAGHALLTREGEVALAARIDAGRRTTLDGLRESPPTLRALMAWRDAVHAGAMTLRDVVDIDAIARGGNAFPAIGSGDEADASFFPARQAAAEPRALACLDALAVTSAKLRRLRDLRIELARNGRRPTEWQARRRRELERDLAASMRKVRLTDTRMEELADELGDLHGRLLRSEGALLRLAAGCGLPQEAFLAQHEGRELETGWLSRVGRLRGEGWRRLAGERRSDVLALRGEILVLSRDSAMEPAEIKRVALPFWVACARPGRQRRRWSRPTCVSWSRSRGSTGTGDWLSPT